MTLVLVPRRFHFIRISLTVHSGLFRNEKISLAAQVASYLDTTLELTKRQRDERTLL